MKRKVAIFVTAVAIFAVVYYLTCYVNVILGAIALGLGINVIDKIIFESIAAAVNVKLFFEND